MTHTVTLVSGGSALSPIMAAVQRVVDATGVSIDWDLVAVPDWNVIDAIVESGRRTGTVLMPYAAVDRRAGARPPVVALRREFECFANVRPLQSFDGIATRHAGVDLVVVRETTEDIYAKLEHESVPGTYESLKVTTAEACERIARFGFDFATKQGRAKVTIVHKANIMKKSDGMFLRIAREVAADFPHIEVEDCIVDALCMKLVLHPEWFDVLLCGNLFGDIVSDLAAGLVGGGANSPSMNVGPSAAVFTSGHGASSDVSGTEDDSPTSPLFAATLMLRHLGENDAADRLMGGVTAALNAKRPSALGGDTKATQFADLVIANMG